VVGAAAEAGIIGGYPDGSFGPKRPTTRAEAVAILDRALPAPVGTEETTTTTTGGSSDGSSEPSGIPVRLTGITVDGTPLASFRPGTQEADIQAANNPALVMGIPYNSSLNVAYRQPSGSGTWTVAENGFSVPVPGSVDILVYRKSAGTNDSRRVTYTLNLVLKSSGEGPQWSEIESVKTEDRSQPAFNVILTRVDITIKPEYYGKIQSIRVKGADAIKISSDPEVWRAGVENEKFTEADLVYEDIVVQTVSEGSRDPIEIPGNWAAPITKVTLQDRSQPSVNVDMTEVIATVNIPSGGMLNGITIKNIPATDLGNNTWRVRINEKFTTITPSEIIVNYTPPSGPVTEALITRFQVVYSDMLPGYLINVFVDRGEVVNIVDIVVTDATTGTVLASLAEGTLTQASRVSQYGSVLSSANDDRSGQVSVTVTTAAKTDTQTINYNEDKSF
jgi:hypothetical protein